METDKAQDVLRVAEEIYRQRPSWVTFFREILGLEGLVRRTFDTPAALARFEASREYHAIQGMLTALRENDADLPGGPRGPTRVITVRLPKSLHESLKSEAFEQRTSMNRLCITKLLQPVDGERVPAEVDTDVCLAEAESVCAAGS